MNDQEFKNKVIDHLFHEEIFDDFDFTKKEDVNKLKEMIQEIKTNESMMIVWDMFFDEDLLDDIVNKAEAIYANAHSQVKVPDRPSTKVPLEQGLQIHKLVQEYVDTMIKPYAGNNLTTQQINDAYAGLVEFAAWLYLK